MIINPYTIVTYASGSTREVSISSSPLYHYDHVYGTTYDEIVPVLTGSTDSVYYYSCLTHFYHFYFMPKSLTGVGLCRIRDPYSQASYSIMLHSFGDDIFYPVPSSVDKSDDNTVKYFYSEYSACLEFKICNNMVYKQLVLEKCPKTNKISFAISRGGGSLSIDKDKVIGYKNYRNLFFTDKPIIFDSSFDNIGMPSYTNPNTNVYWYNQNKSLAIIEIEIDNDWLLSATYPVYIDPSIIITSSEANTSHSRILEAQPTTNYHDQFLSIVNLSGQKTKSLIYFNGLNGVIDGMLINNALLSLRASFLGGLNLPQLQVDRLNRGWLETEATYTRYKTGNNWSTLGCNHIPNDRANTLSPVVSCNPTPGVVTQFDVTDITQFWANNMTYHHGYVIIEPSNLSYVHFASPSYSYTANYTPILNVSYDVYVSKKYKNISYSIGGFNDYIIGK